jgi:formylmethanofuran dehydrogenase subunit B
VADDITLSEEETAIREAAKVACQEALAAFEAMGTDQRAAQAAIVLAAFQALTPEQQAAHEAAHAAAHEAAEAKYLADMADAAIPVLTPLNDNML